MPRRYIVEALADVEAHCSDAGQSPAEAFGDPSDYAEAFARELRPAGFQPSYLRIGTIAILAAGTLTALWCLVLCVAVFLQGAEGRISSGWQTVVAAVMGVTAAIVAHRLGRLRGYLVWMVIIGTAWVGIVVCRVPGLLSYRYGLGLVPHRPVPVGAHLVADHLEWASLTAVSSTSAMALSPLHAGPG